VLHHTIQPYRFEPPPVAAVESGLMWLWYGFTVGLVLGIAIGRVWAGYRARRRALRDRQLSC